ncbi:hypothetical protein [Thermoflexibacter ruber]|uniref:Uncharacterized protein n=1 Tax=Thermoflexibacter ruber TaxID=1003 RepID=A0A1I2JST6_9BACT|nr:hypothetical protein [Thermoflexibacter ruber]SFF56177.1 hypothetical protein SAMN04488541_105816 [Thermoflexibacter ruber]
MKTLIFFIIIITKTFAVYGQDTLCYEKIAFSFFVSHIVKENYENNITFSVKRDISSEISSHLYTSCFQDYYIKYQNISDAEKNSIRNKITEIRKQNQKFNCDLSQNSRFVLSDKSKITKKNKYISINQAEMYLTNLVFVELIVFDKSFENHFFVEIDLKTNEVSRYCKKTISY